VLLRGATSSFLVPKTFRHPKGPLSAWRAFQAEFWEFPKKMAAPLISRLKPNRAALFVCDIQDVFRPLIHRSETIIKSTAFMYKVANVLEVPTVATEQYPQVRSLWVASTFSQRCHSRQSLIPWPLRTHPPSSLLSLHR